MEKSSTFALFSFFPPPGFFYHTHKPQKSFFNNELHEFHEFLILRRNILSVISVISV